MTKALLLTFLLICLPILPIKAETLYDWKIDKVIDGDTVKFKVDFLPPELKPTLLVRINGVDTPEKGKRAGCTRENLQAMRATEFTRVTLLKAKSVKVVITDWDKYGGRVLGDIIVDGNKLSELLIKQGLAREYHGEAKKSWCTE